MNNEKRRFPMLKFAATTLGLGSVFILSVTIVFYILAQYPYNIVFAEKFMYENDYYTVEVTSYVTRLLLHGDVDPHTSRYTHQRDVTAYYNILQLEENYQGEWELESPVVQEEIGGYGNWRLYTESVLPTQKIMKYWWFYPDKPYFKVKIVKEYLVSGENCNNQIIFDGRKTVGYWGEKWLAYQTEWGVHGCIVLDSDPWIEVQPSGGHPTESQLNFMGQSDRDMRYHERGEVEWVELLVYADSYGVWSDIKELGGD